MATVRKEFSATDAHPVILYAKDDADSQLAAPLTASMFNPGLGIPTYDYVSLTPPSLPTSIVFKTGGSGGTTVATLTITYSGTDIATVTRT